jgi:homoserine dehydrogenase
LEQVLDLRPDIVVDTLPSAEPSRQIVHHFLQAGRRVVSANKALVAEHGVAITTLGRGAGRWPTTEAILADLFDLHRAGGSNVTTD